MRIMNLFPKYENSYSSVLGLILKLDSTNAFLRAMLDLINSMEPLFNDSDQAKLKRVNTQFAITNGLIDLLIDFECEKKRHHVYFEVKVDSNQEHGEQINLYSNYIKQQNQNQNEITHTLGILTIHHRLDIRWNTPDAKNQIQFALQWSDIVDILDNKLLANMTPGAAALAEHFKKDIKKELVMDWEYYEFQDWNETTALSFPVLMDGAYYLGQRIRQHLEVRGGGQQIYHFNTWYRDDAHSDGEDEHYFKVNLGQDRRLYIYWVYYEDDDEFNNENFNDNWGYDKEIVDKNIDKFPVPEGGFYAGCLWVGKENKKKGNKAAKIISLSEFSQYFRPGWIDERAKLLGEIIRNLS